MSYELMRAMIDRSQATGSVKTVGIAVASYPPPGGNLSWPSNETLIDEWGLGERTVQRGLRQLEQLGELQRQPRLETPQRPRVYLVDPTFRRQLSLNEAGCQIEPDARLTPVMTPVTSRPPAYEGNEGLRDSPQTPQGGAVAGEAAGPAVNGTATIAMPRVDPQRSTAARRRRGRRRRPPRRIAPRAPEASCPLASVSTDREAPLSEAWLRLEQRIRERIPNCDPWLAGAHLHATGDTIELALPPDLIDWLPSRWGHVLEELAGHPIGYVPCTGTGREEAP